MLTSDSSHLLGPTAQLTDPMGALRVSANNPMVLSGRSESVLCTAHHSQRCSQQLSFPT